MRKDILDKKEDVEMMILENQPKSEICKYLKCKTSTLESYLKKWNIEYKGNMGRKNLCHKDTKNIEDYLSNKIRINTHSLRLKLIKIS